MAPNPRCSQQAHPLRVRNEAQACLRRGEGARRGGWVKPGAAMFRAWALVG